MLHPNTTRFIQHFEREAVQRGSYRKKLGEAELLFLADVWGPAFQYDYEGLHAEYPFKDWRGGHRFAYFVYMKDGIRLLIEIDGFTTHARDISPGEFEDHLVRQNDLVLSGWLVLRFSASHVAKRPQICERQIKQAIGQLWSVHQRTVSADEASLWRMRH